MEGVIFWNLAVLAVAFFIIGVVIIHANRTDKKRARARIAELCAEGEAVELPVNGRFTPAEEVLNSLVNWRAFPCDDDGYDVTLIGNTKSMGDEQVFVMTNGRFRPEDLAEWIQKRMTLASRLIAEHEKQERHINEYVEYKSVMEDPELKPEDLKKFNRMLANRKKRYRSYLRLKEEFGNEGISVTDSTTNEIRDCNVPTS